MSKYYCLISSLPELRFESDDSNRRDFMQIRDYILENVSTNDLHYIHSLLNDIDNHNLMTAVYGKNRSWKKGGILDAESVAKFNRTAMPEYMLVFLEYIDHYRSEHKSSPDENLAENRLLELYYEAMENSRNRFIAQWFRFDREIKNIQAAYSARQQGIPAEDHLIKIKDDDITEFLLKNTSLPEFGLLRERDYMPTLFPTLEIQNPAEREYRLDMLRWQQIDEINVGEYFSVDVVLGTLTKACIADRWMALNVDEGKKLFRQLIDSLINYDEIKHTINNKQ